MQEKGAVDQKASDAELIALVCRAQEAIEAQGELDRSDLILFDFAKELLKQRLLV